MALNNNACLLVAMIVMVSFNAVVNGQISSPSPSPASTVNEWKANMIELLETPKELQLLSIKTFIDVELPLFVENLEPNTRNAVIDSCIKSTKDTITLLDGVSKMIQDNDTMEHIAQALNDAEVAGRSCQDELSRNNVNNVSDFSELVKVYEEALRKTKSNILWEN